MNKRGISAIVTTVLIVLLVVGAVAIFWSTVMPLIVKSGDEIGAEQFLLNLKIVDDSVRLDTDNGLLQRIQIKRKAGQGKISNIKLILIGENGESMVYPFDEDYLEINELETATFEFGQIVDEGAIDYFSEIGDLVEIRVAPVWETKSGERVGNPTDEYKINGNEYSLGCVGEPNGVVEGDETCDDGNNGPAGPCNNNCEYTSCGDGYLQSPNGENVNEVCDLGNENGQYGASCSSNCLSASGPHCGDGNPAGCPPDANCVGAQICNPEGYCVDDGYEVCDDGPGNDEQEECEYGIPECSICDVTCESIVNLIGPYCGDDNVDSEEESCDAGEGNTNTCETDYQSSCNTVSCAYCSDGTNADEEECEPVGLFGACCGDGLEGCLSNLDCSEIPDATCETFGDFNYCIQVGDEVCDAGEAFNGEYDSGCNAFCSGVGPYCGDGDVDSPYEECDDGAGNKASCTPGYPNGECSYCSNGLDGNTACTTQTITAGFCGDGESPCPLGGCPGDQICSGEFCIDEGYEECDDGNTNNNDACIIDENAYPQQYMCKDAYCGDGYLWNQNGGSETCDPGIFQACGMNNECCPSGTFRACSCVNFGNGCNL